MQPISPFILVKVNKAEEENRREMDGSIYRHPNYVWMTRNTQCGIIEGISTIASKEMPEAMVGDILLMHHFVQRSYTSKKDNDKFVATEDEESKYYNVTTKEWDGNNNMCYGVYRDGEIIPHKQYIFLEKEVENKEGWYESSEDVYDKMEKIKLSIQTLSRTKFTPEIIGEIKKREAEMMQLNLKLQEKKFLPYTVAFAHKSSGIKNGSVVYALNVACEIIIDVNDKQYRVVEMKYIASV